MTSAADLAHLDADQLRTLAARRKRPAITYGRPC